MRHPYPSEVVKVLEVLNMPILSTIRGKLLKGFFNTEPLSFSAYGKKRKTELAL